MALGDPAEKIIRHVPLFPYIAPVARVNKEQTQLTVVSSDQWTCQRAEAMGFKFHKYDFAESLATMSTSADGGKADLRF